jgi:eukaryotic-like serine/threonine-protein kinase
MSQDAPSDPVDAAAPTVEARDGRHTPQDDEGTVEPWLAEVAAAPEVPVGPQPGDVLAGAFVIERELGHGGMGVVYLAHQGALERKVAIKLHRAHSPGAAERLLREARALAQVEHEHVIVVHEVGRWHAYVFVAMEYVDGWTAREWAEASPREWREVVELYCKAGRGLQAAHARGLIHRDFKPDNVLVGRDGRVRVADFGLVRAAGQTSSGAVELSSSPSGQPAQSLTDGLVGTPAYMAPEQFRDAAVDAAADQFAFCMSLFEALDGRRPYEGHDAAAQVKQLVRGRPRELDPQRAPAHVRAALRHGLQLHPGDRFPDMAALIRELDRDPAAVWRRRSFGAAAIAATGLATWVLTRPADPMLACLETSEQAWNPERSDLVHAAFAATERPFAEDSFQRVDAAMATRRLAATLQHQAACRAVHVEGTRSHAQLAEHDRCLAQRGHEVAALAELFVERATELVEDSVAAVERLPTIERCSIEQVGSMPIRDEDRPRVAALTQAIAGVDGLIAAGLYDEALAAGESLGAEARELGYPGVESDLLLSLGLAHTRVANHDAARGALRQALRLGIAADNDALAAHAASYLLFIDGYLAPKPGRAEAWFELADDLLEHLGRPPELEAVTRMNHALALRTSGALDASIAEGEAALALTDPSDDLRRALVLSTLGETQRQIGRGETALAMLEESAAAYERALGAKHPSYANAINLLGVTHLLRGEFADAEVLLQRALAIAEPALPPNAALVIDIRVNLTSVLANTGHGEQAVVLLERAWADQQASGRPPTRNTALMLSNLAGMHYELHNFARAHDLQTEALALTLEVVGPDSVEYAGALAQSAAIELDRDPEAALADVDRGLAILTPKLGDDTLAVANARSIRGEVLERLGRCSEALVDLERARVALEPILGDDHPEFGHILLSRARCRLAGGDFDAAERDAERAGELMLRSAGGRSLPAASCAIRAQLGAGELEGARAGIERLRGWAREHDDREARDELEALARALGEATTRRRPG